VDRLFLDANVLFSAAYRPDSGLLRLWNLDNALLLTSRYALEEARINLLEVEQRKRLNLLSEQIDLFEATHRKLPRGISLPEKDAPILLAAIAARATHLLTGDVRHFGEYFGKKIEGVGIMLPGAYLRRRDR
jgi:predicted nucleic acid-binding protein